MPISSPLASSPIARCPISMRRAMVSLEARMPGGQVASSSRTILSRSESFSSMVLTSGRLPPAGLLIFLNAMLCLIPGPNCQIPMTLLAWFAMIEMARDKGWPGSS